MKDLLVRYKNGTGFRSDVLKMVTGSSLARIITILITPLITRIYSPAAYGLFGIFSSIITILSVLACLRYDITIVLPETDREAKNLFGVSVSFSFLIALLSFPILMINREWISTFLNTPEIGQYIWVIPIVILLNGFFSSFNYWNTRKKKFGVISITVFVRSLITSLAQLTAGYIGYMMAGSLIYASVFGLSVGVLTYFVMFGLEDILSLLRSLDFQEMIMGIQRYKRFPQFDLWARLLNSISWQLPSLLLSSYFSTDIVGYYTLGMNLIRVPMSMIGTSIGQVFLQRAASAKNEGNLKVLVERIFRKLVRYSLIPALILTFIGKDLFIIVFGIEWSEAGVFVQLLSVWTFFWFISSPLSSLFRVLEKQRMSLLINIGILLTRILSIIAGGVFRNARLSLLLFSITGIVLYGYLSISTLQISEVIIKRFFEVLGSYFIRFIPIGIVLALFVVFQVSPIVNIFFGGGATMVYYLFVMREDSLLF